MPKKILWVEQIDASTLLLKEVMLGVLFSRYYHCDVNSPSEAAKWP